MQFGLSIPAFGDFANMDTLIATAQMAEEAGWDGFFIWDHVVFTEAYYAIPSTWVALAAIAMNTSRMKLGAMVTPLSRRRPWNVAREAVSVDQLANGRLIFGAGLGEPVAWDFGHFNEEQDARKRAERLDEGLEIITGLWTGEPFHYEGTHYQLKEVIFQPCPVQSPRIPIWIGGGWDKKRPMRRAARYDGFFPLKWMDTITLDEWRGIMQTVNAMRQDDGPYDWIHGGQTPGNRPDEAADIVRPYAEIGITWWVEGIGEAFEGSWRRDITEAMQARIRQGPPHFA